MVIRNCTEEHKDLCDNCNKPTETRCPTCLKCKCAGSSKITAKELIVGHRFKSATSGVQSSTAFRGASEGTVLAIEMPIAGPVWKYKDRGDWIVKCYGCSETKSSKIEHSWLIKWAFKHRCLKRIDIPR